MDIYFWQYINKVTWVTNIDFTYMDKNAKSCGEYTKILP